MREQLIQYVNLLFAGSPDNDMKQEILQNTLDRYDDLVAQGKSPEAAYRLAISGIGDINEIFGSTPAPAAESPAPNTDYRGRPLPSKEKKTLRAVAIGLYICCVIPVIALGSVGDGILGVCLMFLMIAAATVLIILSSGGSQETEHASARKKPQHPAYKIYDSISTVVMFLIYFVVSFWSGAWYITWLIFPIFACIDGVVTAIFDLKEAEK